jgi:hypothetical protein
MGERSHRGNVLDILLKDPLRQAPFVSKVEHFWRSLLT